MRRARNVLGIIFFSMCITATALAASTSSATLSSSDGKTEADAKLTVTWATFSKDTATAKTEITDGSSNKTRGCMSSIFGYQDGSCVGSVYKLATALSQTELKGNCDKFVSKHAITVSGSSTSPLGTSSYNEMTIKY